MKKILVSTIAALTLSTSVMAEVNSQTGCGLGSKLIKNDSSAVILALQATTNGTLSNQAFGITLGTSGCKSVDFVMNERAEEFVASYMDILAKEIALGHGESIDTLAELLEIKDTATFSASLQSNYNSIYTSKSLEIADVLDGSLGLVIDKHKFMNTNLEYSYRWYDTGTKQSLITAAQSFRLSQNIQLKFKYNYKEKTIIDKREDEQTYRAIINYYF